MRTQILPAIMENEKSKLKKAKKSKVKKAKKIKKESEDKGSKKSKVKKAKKVKKEIENKGNEKSKVKKAKKIKKEIEDKKIEEPTDEDLKAHIRRLIPFVNLENTGVKAFTKLLSKECGGVDLKPRMKFIKAALSEAINELEDDDDSDDESDEEEEAPKKPRRTGLSVKKEISPKLAKFLGRDPSELVARTEVVKDLWEYIRAKNLQNPENKREIILDKKMKELFGCDTFTMFTINKYIGAHIHPFKPVDLTTNSTKASGKKRKKGDDDGDTKRKKKRKPKQPGLQPPYRLSKELSDLLGTDILPRPQVVKGIWAHIKKHDLQNPNDKREILCDKKLKKVMGGEDKVTMFSMNRYITDHFLEKLDRSEYNHAQSEAELLAREEEE